ncbi:putative immunity protein [Diplocloster modestus]|uniref:Imm-5-like domain-containing protein n=1 Tax=Diplocloster modestus TaxID=2850322 RepID=A0ABS6KA04_9FIRM|nr:hypothetical protein [Diplocloster modestus]MBU9727348.1 hypothetical protein [Diplocloster modestus]
MAKLRKMLGSADSPYIISLMRLIETQSKSTIANWCVDYVTEHIAAIYRKAYPEDRCPEQALEAFREYQNGKIKLTDLKKAVAEVNNAAKAAEENPAAQAAARAVGQAAAAIYTPTHSLGLAFYGSAAVAYDRAGLSEKPEVYEQIASEECGRMLAALQAVAVENEEHPAKINWYC